MKSKPSLFFCLFMDLAGMATFTIPAIGGFVDILWAPLSAFIFYITFGGKTGKVGSVVNLLEELLPGIDFIPTFTLAYIYKTIIGKSFFKLTR